MDTLIVLCEGITVFKIFIWGGTSLEIWLEIGCYGDERVKPKNKISDLISNDIPPQMKILNMVVPILMLFCSFI